MAEAMGKNNHADIADIARILGKPVTSMSDVRSRLLRKKSLTRQGAEKCGFGSPTSRNTYACQDSSYPFKQMP